MRQPLLEKATHLALVHPKKVLAGVGIAMLLAAATLPFFRVHAGHSGIVDDDAPYQARYLEFQARYGSPTQLIVMIEGGSEAKRRALADVLAEALPTEREGEGEGEGCDPDAGPRAPGCVRDVLARIDLDELSERALLYLPPEDLRELVDRLTGEGFNLETLRRVRGAADLFEKLSAEVERLAEQSPGQEGPPPEAREATDTIAEVFRTVEARVRDPKASIPPLQEVVFEGRSGRGIDARGYLSSESGHLKLVVMRPVVEDDEPSVVVPFVRYVQRHARRLAAQVGADCTPETCPDGPLRTILAGFPAVIADEAEEIAHSVVVTGVLATFGLLLVLFLGFRSLPQTLLALTPLVPTLLLVLAFTWLFFGGFNLITAATVPVMLGLCIDFAVHLLSRYNEHRQRGETVEQAIENGVMNVGPGLVTGALTTAGAFLALGVTDFKGIREMGFITGFGLLTSLVLTVLVIPALLRLLPMLQGRNDEPAPGFLRKTLAGAVSRRAPLFAGLGLALALGSFFYAREIPWSYDYTELLPADAESTAALKRITEETSYSGEVAAFEARSLDEARVLTARLDALESVERVESIAEYVPTHQDEKLALLRRLKPALDASVEGSGPEPVDVAATRTALEDLSDAIEDVQFDAARTGREAQGKLLDAPKTAARALAKALAEVPPTQAEAALAEFQARLLNGRDQGVARLRAHVEGGPITVESLLPRLPEALRDRLHHEGRLALYAYPSRTIWNEANLRRLMEETRTVQPEVTGLPTSHFETMAALRAGLRDATLVALLALTLLLLVDFRSIRYAMLALVPLGLGVLLSWAALTLIDVKYNPGNVVSLPLVLGIAIDSSVHILHRFKQEPGHDVTAVVAHTGRAILLSGMTTIVGFGALLFASYRAMASFGVILMIGVGACLLAAVCFLPAVLRIVGQRSA